MKNWNFCGYTIMVENNLILYFAKMHRKIILLWSVQKKDHQLSVKFIDEMLRIPAQYLYPPVTLSNIGAETVPLLNKSD